MLECEVEGLVALLWSKNAAAACDAFRKLQDMSRASSCVYPHLDEFFELLEDRSSLARNRAIGLIAANARWDAQGVLEAKLPQLLNHLTDEKPITARQCVQAMPEIALACPALRGAILSALDSADFSAYRDSMRPLLQKDAMQAAAEIRGMG